MKNILLSVLLLVVCALLGYNLWKSRSGGSATGGNEAMLKAKEAADNDFSNVAVDTMAGFKGFDRAGMYTFPGGERKFIYQNYSLQVVPKKNGEPGETIAVSPTEGGIKWEIPLPEASSFIGVYREHLIVNVDVSKDKHELLFIDLKDKRAAYRSEYVDTPFITGGKLRYHSPIPENEMSRVPDCPEKSEWEGKGKKTAYGQVVLYDFSNGSVTKKSEYKCYGVAGQQAAGSGQ